MKIDNLRDNAIVIQAKESKGTARCPQQVIYSDNYGNKYLHVIAESEVQRFYLKRSIEMQKKWADALNHCGFMINLPIDVKMSETRDEALYIYYENLRECRNLEPIRRLKKFWKYSSHLEKNTYENQSQCMNRFLAAWPDKYHDTIKQFNSYSDYVETLQKKKELYVGFEHGDFTKNNILLDEKNNLWLMDFEFAKEGQPYGMDEYDLCRTIGRKSIFKRVRLNNLKHKLMDDINNLIDNDCK